MKFFDIIPLSSFQLGSLAYLYDAPNIPVPFHRLYYPYSMRRTRLPRNGVPSIASLTPEILAGALLMSYPLISLPSYLYSTMVDILYACVHDPYSLPLLEFSHSHCYKFVPVNLDTESEHPLLEHGNDTWSPILYEHLANLQYENSFEYLPYRKFRAFIETKVAAMKLRGFNLN